MMLKQTKFKGEMAEIKSLKFINKVIVNDRKDDFMKKAQLYIVFQLYKLK